MSKGVVIHLDNDIKGILEPAKSLFDQMDFDLDYIICNSKEEFKTKISENNLKIKSIIFDLLSQEPRTEEIVQYDPEFLEEIESSFMNFNVPVFIYSGYLNAVDGKFTNNGTVYKFDKAKNDIETIFNKIKFFSESGFIDVFSPNGIIETEINKELNTSFTKQFSKNTEIESIINSILDSVDGDQEKKKDRVKTVFKRIAIKSLSSDLLAPVADDEDKVHPIEHFYKRQSNLKFWTGDIWKHKKDSINVIILTPRCDVSKKNLVNLMFCSIKGLPKPIKTTGNKEEVKKNLNNYLTDNLQGKSQRYIPQNIFFPEGGLLELKDHNTLKKEQFFTEYEYIITLSDDFTNEIIGKFAYYFLRTGITTINDDEFKSTIESLNIVDDGN